MTPSSRRRARGRPPAVQVSFPRAVRLPFERGGDENRNLHIVCRSFGVSRHLRTMERQLRRRSHWPTFSAQRRLRIFFRRAAIRTGWRFYRPRPSCMDLSARHLYRRLGRISFLSELVRTDPKYQADREREAAIGTRLFHEHALSSRPRQVPRQGDVECLFARPPASF